MEPHPVLHRYSGAAAAFGRLPAGLSPADPDRSFLIGRDLEGHWVAQDSRGLSGGLFVSREAAIHFAIEETGHRPNAVRFADGPLAAGFGRP